MISTDSSTAIQPSDLALALAPNMKAPRPRVLVIDDESSILRLIQRALGSAAEVILELGAPEPGVIDFGSFDVAILDYKMPRRDGLEVLREIRVVAPDLPVIFLTGFDDPALSQASLDAGANDFLLKPFDAAQVRERVIHHSENVASKSKPLPEEATRRLEPTTEDAREFRARTDFGEALDGVVYRFDLNSALIDIPANASLAVGDVLHGVEVRFGRQFIEAANGWVTDVTRLSDSLQVSVILPQGWAVTECDSTGAPPVVEERADESQTAATAVAAVATYLGSEIDPMARLAVHDLADVIDLVRSEVDRFESQVTTTDPIERHSEEREFLSKMTEQFAGVVQQQVARFEEAARTADSVEAKRTFKSYARRVLYPKILCSPFMARIVERPIGVPGDFGMLGQILGSPWEGSSLFARALNSWILTSEAASAYRFRVDLLEREIRRCVREKHERGTGPARLLSMASGVAFEVQRYAVNPESGLKADFNLIDFSDITLDEAKRQYQAIGKLPDEVDITFRQSSVIELAKQAKRSQRAGGASESFLAPESFDHVYCAGLFDYLNDLTIKLVVGYLYSLVGRGGTVLVSNFTPLNPIQEFMTFVLDWELIYRTNEHFEELVRAAAPNAEVTIECDADGVEVYALLRRPE